MANLAIIPARGGSKRIARKNVRDFFGKPIISYQIELALECGIFDEVMVSTEDEEIVRVSQANGASVPFERSAENANDFATLTDVVLEVIEEYESLGRHFENVCCLLPTSVLIKKENLELAYHRLTEKEFTSVIPIVRYAYPIQRALKTEGDTVKMRESENLRVRSQDLEPFFHDSGQFYWIKTEQFLKDKNIISENSGFIELSELEVQDVDTELDWNMMEMKYRFKLEQQQKLKK